MTRSWFEEKQEEKKRKLRERAEHKEREAKAAEAAAERLANAIPLGQPILVGHHSEKRHRKDLSRIDAGLKKASDKAKEAEELERRADAIGTGGISSDDPEALEKLGWKLKALLERQEWMKKVSAAWRAAGKPAPDAGAEAWEKLSSGALESAVLDQVRLEMAKRWAFQPGAPFPSYALSNLSAEVRRLERRIEALKKAASRPPTDEDRGICRLLENVDKNRIQLVFSGKPTPETRALLKTWGFRWAPSEGAWQRHLNDAGRSAVRIVLEKLKGGKP